MSIRRGRLSAQRSLPLGGILAVFVGCGLLFAYWKFSQLTPIWTDLGRMAFVAVAVLLALWGTIQILAGLRLRHGTRRRYRFRENRVMLPREGAVYLLMMSLLLVGSLIGRSNMLMLVFAMMAGPFVVNGWATFVMLKRITVRRRVPSRAMAGQPVSVDVELTNGKRWLSSWVMMIHDRVANASESLRSGVLFTRVPPRQTRNASYQLRLMQRGTYRLGPIHVTTRFPLGLVERGLIVDVFDEILIYPRLGRLSSQWKQNPLTAAELVQREELRRGTYDDEFHRIREYRWGDNPRAIHWRTSARHNELMVCEYRQSRAPRLTVLLDLWSPARPSERNLERVELAVSLAATLCVEYLREGHNPRLSLATAGKKLTQWEGRSGPGNLDSVLETLAVVEAGPAADVKRMLETSARKRTAGTRTVLITTRSQREAPNVPGAGSHGPSWEPRGIPTQSVGTRASDNGNHLQVIHVTDPEVSSFFWLELGERGA